MTAIKRRSPGERLPEGSPSRFDLNSASPPFDYNTSSWRQRVPIAVLGFVGFAIAGYMGLYQWGFIPGVWDPVFGNQSEQVLRSETSLWMERWMLVPDAILGAIAYLGDAIYGLAGSTRRWQTRPWMTILFGFDVIPLGIVSVILVVAQGTVVGAWCFLCLVTAAISVVLIALAYDEVWSCLRFLHYVWTETHDPRTLWDALWGVPSPAGIRLARTFVNAMATAESPTGGR